MKSLRALKAAGLILAAVTLGLMTVQGSYALWNATVNTAPSTIQAADFRIELDNLEMGTTLDFPVGQLARGGKATKYFEVKNMVNVTPDSPLRLRISLAGLGPVAGFGGYLNVSAAAVPIGTRCDTLLDGSFTAALPASVLAKGKPQGYCLKTELSKDTPPALMGQAIASKAVTLDVAQTVPVK